MATNNNQQQRKQKDVMDLEKYLDKRIHVKFTGGREGKSWKTINFV